MGDIESWRRLGDPTFEQHFRMDSSLFEKLLVAIGHHLETHDRWHRRSRKGHDIAGVKFGVLEGTVPFHYKYIFEALREMSRYYTRWPNELEQELISCTF
ncbi:50S ribosomal protein L24 [Frankliniella fusca]|uniref:50S ribosomal protein L24 n=1 Tax=Frankliniella fusca TaxID=407009 RepID=A0AAE1HSM0_9NEOP|nr:50S ribosomal protein L24 [Frankliniella fusca]